MCILADLAKVVLYQGHRKSNSEVRFGRKIAILGSMLLSTTASLVGAFMPDYWTYLVLRSFLQIHGCYVSTSWTRLHTLPNTKK